MSSHAAEPGTSQEPFKVEQREVRPAIPDVNGLSEERGLAHDHWADT
jgi:hypothetical protein